MNENKINNDEIDTDQTLTKKAETITNFLTQYFNLTKKKQEFKIEIKEQLNLNASLELYNSTFRKKVSSNKIYKFYFVYNSINTSNPIALIQYMNINFFVKSVPVTNYISIESEIVKSTAFKNSLINETDIEAYYTISNDIFMFGNLKSYYIELSNNRKFFYQNNQETYSLGQMIFC